MQDEGFVRNDIFYSYNDLKHRTDELIRLIMYLQQAIHTAEKADTKQSVFEKNRITLAKEDLAHYLDEYNDLNEMLWWLPN